MHHLIRNALWCVRGDLSPVGGTDYATLEITRSNCIFCRDL